MELAALRFSSLLFTAINLSAGMAHLLAMPQKMQLDRQEYFIVQQIYRGWALLGIAVMLAIVSTLLLAMRVRQDPEELSWAVAALTAMIAAQVLFWTFTYPANQVTANWTSQPQDWMMLRTRWEYSHAAGALLQLIAFVALAWPAARAAK